jgi:hypothetical protein
LANENADYKLSKLLLRRTGDGYSGGRIAVTCPLFAKVRQILAEPNS